MEFVSAVEMRFKGPLMHLDGSGSPTPPLGKVLERPPPSSQTQFREHVLPRPDSTQQTEDPSSTSSAPTSLTPPQTSTPVQQSIEEEPIPEPKPEPHPEPEPPRLTIIHKTTTEHYEEETNNVEEGETEAVNATSFATSMFCSTLTVLVSLQLFLRLVWPSHN